MDDQNKGAASTPASYPRLVGAIEIAEAMRDKHSSPTGDQYNCGAWDMAQRIVGKLRSATTQMVVVSTTDMDHNGEHIERLIPASNWRSGVAEWQRYTDSFGWQRVEEAEIEHYRNKGSSLRALYEHPPQSKVVGGNTGNTIADLPDRIWVDASDMSIHANDGDGRKSYVIEPVPKRNEHYKSDDEVNQIRDLAQQGMSQKQIAETLGINARTVRKFAGRVYGQNHAAKSPSQVRDLMERHYNV